MAQLCVSYTNDYFSCFSCFHWEVQSCKKSLPRPSPTHINENIHRSTYGHSASQNGILLHSIFCFSYRLPLTWNFSIRTHPFCLRFVGGRQNTRTNIEMKGGALFENYSYFTVPLTCLRPLRWALVLTLRLLMSYIYIYIYIYMTFVA